LDASLAALAIEHGLVVLSADSDFARFPDVRWEKPLLSDHDFSARDVAA
jgi:predicted nucleic acid-binding protein